MITFTKYLAFYFSLSFIAPSQAVKSIKTTIPKTPLDDKITQLIIANHTRKSFEKYEKCSIEYHSEIDTDTNQTLSVLTTRFKVPRKNEPVTVPSGTQLFRYKLLKAYRVAKKQKQLRKDGKRLRVDYYTSLRMKPLVNPLATKTEEEQSTPTSNKSSAKEMIGTTIIPENEYINIKNRWTPQPPEPPTNLYT